MARVLVLCFALLGVCCGRSGLNGFGDDSDVVVRELTPDGPENLTRVSDFGRETSLDGWSYDGRYFAQSNEVVNSGKPP